MSTPSSTPPGWYADPASPGTSMQRWWSGLGWTEHVANPTIPVTPETPETPETPTSQPVVFDKKAHNIFVSASVFEAVTILLISAYFLGAPWPFTFLEFAVAITTLILEMKKAQLRRREDAIRGWQVALQLLVGIAGIAWFVFLLAYAIHLGHPHIPQGGLA